MNDTGTDVLVIGAGLTGAMIAARLADQNVRVGVVDAQQVGQSATRRALGLATTNPQPAHREETAHGVELLKHVAAQHGVLLQSCHTLHLASTPERQQTLQDIAETEPKAQIEWTTQPDVLPPGYSGGLLVHDSALVDVATLMIRLLQHPNITVRQFAEVFKLEWHRDRTYALCKEYTVGARCVVLATNAYAGLLSPYLADSVRGVRGAIWSSRPLRDRVDVAGAARAIMPLVVDDAKLMLVPGNDARLKAAAWQWNGPDETADPSDELHRFLKAVDPSILSETEQWITGVTTTTDDGAPLVGKLDTEGMVLYALGLGGYGLAWSAVVAEKIAALVQSR